MPASPRSRPEKKQIRLGDVSPTRDFNYILNTCRGFVWLHTGAH